MFDKEINYTAVAAGILAIASSFLNYNISGDEISLGIILFAGLGFIFLSIKEKPENIKLKPNARNRFKTLSYFFFSISLITLFYWLVYGKLMK